MTLTPRAFPAACLLVGTLFPGLLLLAGCRTTRKPEVAGAPESAPPAPAPEPPPPAEVLKGEEPELTVKKVLQELVVAAWAEPRALPESGGQAQLLVRVQKRGGAPFPGVEVRFKTSTGSLFSRGKVLVTDRGGKTRDRVTTKKTATITLNAGGTRYTFRVPVGE
jgi:hypothetical protein